MHSDSDGVAALSYQQQQRRRALPLVFSCPSLPCGQRPACDDAMYRGWRSMRTRTTRKRTRARSRSNCVGYVLSLADEDKEEEGYGGAKRRLPREEFTELLDLMAMPWDEARRR